MYVLDYLIYNLKPYGIQRLPGRLPKKLDVGEFLPAPNVELGIADSNEDSINDEDRMGDKLNATSSTQSAENDVDEGGEVP